MPDWAAHRGDVEVERIFPAGRVVLRPANTIEPALPTGWDLADYQFHGTYVARIPDAQLVGALGLVVLPDGSFAAESIFNASHLREAEPYRSWSPTRAVRHRGNSYSLLIQYALDGNYYHWLHDVVMRLHGVLDRLPEDTQFIVPPRLRPYQYDTLAMLGIDRSQLREFDGRESWLLESLFFSPVTPGAPAAFAWLREVALRANDVSLGPPTRRIYVTRRHAAHHRVVNEPEVEALLREHGFETHALETLSFAEQVALFATAEVLVTSHGAGTTNILFAPPGLKIVELFEPTFVSASPARQFWIMSTSLGHEYWCLVGDPVPGAARYGDIDVPLDKLAKTLGRVLLAHDEPASD